VESGKLLRTYRVKDQFNALAFCRDGQTFFSGSKASWPSAENNSVLIATGTSSLCLWEAPD
jgi:hypothetical protein